MAMRRVTGAAIRACVSSSSSGSLARQFHASSGDSKKIVGVFYKANEYASKNPNFLGCVENALGIRSWLESQGHQYVVTNDKEGADCELEKHIPDLHVLISTPFHPAYVTAERIKKAKNLQLLLTAGIGSDHIDLQAAAAAGLTVAEVTGSNVVSVAEDELMRILILMRNFVPGYNQVVNGEWNVAGIAYRAYDLEGKTVGTVGAGRIGKLLLQRLKPFGCNLLYHDRLQMGPEMEKETGAKYVESLDEMLPKCDVVVVNTPLTEKTRGMFNSEMIGKMKKGVLIVNNARGAIMDRQAVVEAVESGSEATNLQNLTLMYCTSLVELPSSIRNLHKLETLNMKGCEKLRVIPTNINLASLERVDMSDCLRLRTFPDLSSNIKHLDVLNTMIEDVPSTIAEGWLHRGKLNIGSKSLKRLTHVPEYVHMLDLSNSDIKKIPDCVIGLSELQNLTIRNCRKLVSVQGLPPSLLFLDADDCVSLKSVCFSFNKPNVRSENDALRTSRLFYIPRRTFTFYNCYSLEEEARRVIIQGWDNMKVALPGKEVPSEFTHKAKGNSITICDRTFSASSRFKACLLLSPPDEKSFFAIEIVCRLRSKGVLINEIRFYPNIRHWYSSRKSLPKLLTDHLFVFDWYLFKDGRCLEADSDIQFEFSCNYVHYKIIECGVLILAENGESSSSSSEWEEQSDEAVEVSEDENVVKTSKHTGWLRGLKKLVLKKKKNKTE